MSLPDQIRDNCQEEAYVMVNRFNCPSDRQTDKQETPGPAFDMENNSHNDKEKKQIFYSLQEGVNIG